MNNTRNNHIPYASAGGETRQRPATARVRFPDNLPDASSSSSPSTRNNQQHSNIVLDVITALMAITCMGGFLTILVVLYVTVKPFSQGVYRRLVSQMGACSFLDAMALLLPNTKIYLTGDSDVPSPVGTSLMVCNHLVDADWWAVFMLGRCIGLRGTIKAFMRNEYLHVNVQSTPAEGIHTALTVSRSNGNLASVSSSRLVRGESGSHSPSSTTGASIGSSSQQHTVLQNNKVPDLSIMARLLHVFLEFPLINGEDYISDREQLFQLLRSFAQENSSAHFLLFPEAWSLHNGANRESVLAKSNEFAKREGRPQLKKLLLPRTRGFNASLECLRESNPVVYDVTLAYKGYDGSLPPPMKLNLAALWLLLRRKFPKEIHIRIKRYSMEEVLHDASWLDKTWAEKDRLLSHFARFQSFPQERFFGKNRLFDTRQYSIESSMVNLVRLLLLPWAVPVLLLLSFPLLWTVLWIWMIHRVIQRFISPQDTHLQAETSDSASGNPPTPGSVSAGTPYLPATPFASPAFMGWRDMFHRNSNS